MYDSSGSVVKGIGFLGVFKFIKMQPKGEELLEIFKKQLPEEAARICSRRLITVREYPYSAFVEVLRTFDKVLGIGNLSVLRDLGEYSADMDFEFLFAGSSAKPSPEDLFRDCNIYWSSYYPRSGYMKAEEIKPERSIVRIYDFPEMDPAHCRLIEGWMAKAMINSGAALKRCVETKCTSKGDPYHEFTGAWAHAESGVDMRKRFGADKFAKPLMTL